MHKRITITIDEEILRLAEERVAAGEARSLSAFIAQATETRVRRETVADFAAEVLAQSGGPATPEEDAWARRALGMSYSTPAR
jgi:hypothetical protein